MKTQNKKEDIKKNVEAQIRYKKIYSLFSHTKQQQNTQDNWENLYINVAITQEIK